MSEITYNECLEFLLETFSKDYENHTSSREKKYFTEEYSVSEGRTYDKIVKETVWENGDRSGKSVVGFVVKKATKKFQVGDVLKSASWNSPATNFARASIFDFITVERAVRWTGVS